LTVRRPRYDQQHGEAITSDATAPDEVDALERADLTMPTTSTVFVRCNYAQAPECRLYPGTVEGCPALLAADTPDGAPSYFMLVEQAEERVTAIRDYRYPDM
jgi:hypothetical protein